MITHQITTGKQFINEFASFLNEFVNATGYDKFVPCMIDAKNPTKKPPCIKGWEAEQRSIQQIKQNPPKPMQMIALYPGCDYIILDCDGFHSVQLVKKIEEEIEALPPTLHPSRSPGDREARIFLIPAAYKERFAALKDLYIFTGGIMGTPGKDQLEIRKGSNYQVICGYHPSGVPYQQLGTTVPEELPESWCEWFINIEQTINEMRSANLPGVIDDTSANQNKSGFSSNGNSKSKDNVKNVKYSTNVLDNETQLCYAASFIECLIAVGHPKYQLDDRFNRVRIGMMLHSIDDGAEGSRAVWDEFCSRHESYSDEGSANAWKGFKSKVGGITMGTLRWDFQQAFPDVEKIANQELNGNEQANARKAIAQAAVEAYRGLSGQSNKLSMMEFFTDTYESVKNIPGYNLDNALMLYSNEYRIRLNELSELYEKFAERQSQNIESILSAIESSKYDLDIDAIYRSIPGSEKLVEVLADRGHDKFMCLMIWLTVIGGISPKNRLANFYGSDTCPISLFTFINGDSGKGKSPLYKTFTNVIKELDKQNRNIDDINKERYEDKMDEWKDTGKKERGNIFPVVYQDANGNEIEESEIHEYENTGEEDKAPPKKPKPPKELRNLIYDDGTPEDMIYNQASVKDFNILWTIDEIVKVIKIGKGYSANSETSSTIAQFIAMWNGDFFKRRILSKGNFNGVWGYGLLGGIQPEVLETAFNLNHDSQGFAARLIILDGSNLDVSPTNPHTATDILNCDDYLKAIYEAVFQLPGVALRPSAQAWQVWYEFDRECMTYSDSHSITKGFAYWLRKCAQNVARIASCLHTLKIACGAAIEDSEEEYETISDESIYQAIAIGRKLMADHSKLYSSYIPKTGSEDADPVLGSHITYILNYLAKQSQPVILNKIRGTRYFKDKKIGSSEVKGLLDELVLMSKVEFLPGVGYQVVRVK